MSGIRGDDDEQPANKSARIFLVVVRDMRIVRAYRVI
jgi:hypothetical protein